MIAWPLDVDTLSVVISSGAVVTTDPFERVVVRIWREVRVDGASEREAEAEGAETVTKDVLGVLVRGGDGRFRGWGMG